MTKVAPVAGGKPTSPRPPSPTSPPPDIESPPPDADEEAEDDEEKAEEVKGMIEELKEGIAEKMFRGGGAEAMDIFSEQKLGKLMDGGGKPLEMMNLGISFLQSFSLVALLDFEYPNWFGDFSLFTFDFSFTEDAGPWPTIWIGLLAAPFLIFQLDHGLFLQRDDDGYVQGKVSSNYKYSKTRRQLQAVILVSFWYLCGFVVWRSTKSSGEPRELEGPGLPLPPPRAKRAQEQS
jgi:hypothetical protein